jgi:hypothetical protein
MSLADQLAAKGNQLNKVQTREPESISSPGGGGPGARKEVGGNVPPPRTGGTGGGGNFFAELNSRVGKRM